MDPVSHGLLGAALAESIADKNEIRLASLTGFLSAMLADADVFIRSTEDPLLTLDYHRQFTHSLIFIPVGGLIAAAILWLFLRRRMRFRKIYLYATLGYATAGLLDACTSYGTQLLWPFSDARIAWNVISIIDPVFTLTVAVFVIVAVVKKSRVIARAGLAFVILYLLLGLYQREGAEDVTRALAESRGHEIERMIVHSSIGNIILWRSVYESDGVYYTDTVRRGFLSEPRVYEGGSLPAVEVGSDFQDVDPDSVLYRDILRFEHFSDGYLVVNPQYPDVLGDLRYSLLPNGIIPLWGIVINTERQDRHVTMFDYHRAVTADKWRAFMTMLRGGDLSRKGE